MKKYVLGSGVTSITGGRLKEIDMPFIRFARIEEGKKVGEDLLGTDVEETDECTIIIKNLAGLAVLEKAVKIAKKNLKESNKRTGL